MPAKNDTRPTISVVELRPDLYLPTIARPCGHTHEGPRYNTAPAALRYATRVAPAPCGACRAVRRHAR